MATTHLYSQIEFRPMSENTVYLTMKWFNCLDISGISDDPISVEELQKSYLNPFKHDTTKNEENLSTFIRKKNSVGEKGDKPNLHFFSNDIENSKTILCKFRKTSNVNEKNKLKDAVIAILLSKIYLDSGSLTEKEVNELIDRGVIFQPPAKTILNYSKPDKETILDKRPSIINTLENLKSLKNRLLETKKKYSLGRRSHLPIVEEYNSARAYVFEDAEEITQKNKFLGLFSLDKKAKKKFREIGKIEEKYKKKVEELKPEVNKAINKAVKGIEKEVGEYKNIINDFKDKLPDTVGTVLPSIETLSIDFDENLKPEQNIKLFEETEHRLITAVKTVTVKVMDEEEKLRDEITSLEEHDEKQLGEVDEYDIDKIKQTKPIIRDIVIGDITDVQMNPVYYHIEGLDDISIRDNQEGFRHELEFYTESKTTTEEETEEYRAESEEIQKEIGSEFSKDVSKSLNKSISASAGLKASAQYTCAKIEVSANVSYSRSKSQQENSSTKSTEKIIQNAKKEFSNRKYSRYKNEEMQSAKETIIRERKTPDKSSGTKPFTNLTAWICCDYEVKIIRYNNALTLVFDIPEPGVWLLEKMKRDNSGLDRPIKHKITVSNVSEENLRYWAEAYPEAELTGPPPEILAIPFNINTTPTTSGNEWNAHLASKTLQIPESYKPTKLSVATVSTYKGGDYEDWHECKVSTCGKIVINLAASGWADGLYYFDDYEKNADYPNGLDISVRLISIKNNIGQVNGQLYCERTEKVMQKWKQEVVQKVIEAQEERISIYERKLARLAMNGEGEKHNPYQERSPIENQKIIRDELSKWCIQAMTGQIIDNVLVRVIVKGETKHVEPDLSAEHDVKLGLAYLMNDWFEWDGMTHFDLPYFWSRRARWRSRLNINIADKEYQSFLQAGCSTVYLPVKAGAEKHVLSFISKLQEKPEEYTEIITSFLSDEPDPDSEDIPHIDIVSQILQERKKGYILGSGTISIRAVDDKRKAVITYTDEDFLTTRWYPAEHDNGRIIEIEGCDCIIESAVTDNPNQITVTLAEDYSGRDVTKGRYRLKGVIVGSPFIVTLPTGKSVLVDDELSKTLSRLNSMLK